MGRCAPDSSGWSLKELGEFRLRWVGWVGLGWVGLGWVRLD
jgi:hypothetical protein